MDGNGGGSGRPDGLADSGSWAVPGYTHERKLGAGASGTVFLARHDASGRAVAVKYLAAPLGQDPRFRTAFRGEAELLGGLDSPYIARFYEYVEDGPYAAIVMELVDGIALHALLREEGATEPEPALAVLKGSLLGLAAAHAAGVVHRDYKPANVLVTPDGVSKLVDFGVALRTGESGGVAGTPSYMAPEQWAGRPATPATDVYAATATFYECLTGTKPYAGSTMFELAVQHAEAPIPNEHVPEPVRPLIRRGLAKTPWERPQSAAEFVAELQAVATAAYGEDWEERGQRKLAALVALLPLLFWHTADPGASGTTALAHTELAKGGGAGGGPYGSAGSGAGVGAGAGVAAGALTRHRPVRRRLHLSRRGKFVAGAVAAVLVCTGLVVTAVATNGGGPVADDSASIPSALTSLTPASGPPVAPASATSASGSPSPSASDTATPSGTATASATATATTTVPGGTAPGGTTPPVDPPTAPGGPTATSAPPTATSKPTTPAPTLHVSLVQIGNLSCDGPTGIAGSVSIRGDGAADGTLTLSWFHVDANGASTVVATEPVPIPAGKTSFSGTYPHDFGKDTGLYWGLSVATEPAADTGQGSSDQVSSRTCRAAAR